MSTLAEIYIVGMAASFPVGFACCFLLLFFTGFCDKPLHKIGAVDVALNFAPAVMAATAAAAAGAIIWPLAAFLYACGYIHLIKRLFRMAAASRAQKTEEDRWPVSLQKPIPAPPGIEFQQVPAERKTACPICMEELRGEVKVCPSCGTAHHAECWTFHGGCGMYACKPPV